MAKKSKLDKLNEKIIFPFLKDLGFVDEDGNLLANVVPPGIIKVKDGVFCERFYKRYRVQELEEKIRFFSSSDEICRWEKAKKKINLSKEEKDEAVKFCEWAKESIHELQQTIKKVIETDNDDFLSKIPAKIRKQYALVGDFSQTNAWRAPVILRCNHSGNSIGETGGILYCFINIKTEQIIPVAREDEHHEGYDLLYHLLEEKIIQGSVDSWISISTRGSNYIYNKKDFLRYVKAFKIFRDNGGPNSEVVFPERDGEEGFVLLIDDFLNNVKNKKMIEKGVLLPLGAQVINALEQISLRLIHLREEGTPKTQMDRQLIQLLPLLEIKGIDAHFDQSINECVKRAKENPTIENVEKEILGQDGYKNKIHIQVKKTVESKYLSSFEFSRWIFGDVSYALKELNRLSSIRGI